ncbi:MAG: flavin reductase family protein [Boseongicola sp. SB0662_bin_57]|nr:flavin reductase family protein [Boseongicola sp. SB0662_bin_57]
MTTTGPSALRDAFGGFMTGVTVVTTRNPGGAPLGFTANSFSSVSLDPPMLLVCLGRSLSSHNIFATCTHFAVSVLAEGQEDVSNVFASFKGDRFARIAHGSDANGIPVIDNAVSQFSCRRTQSIPAGDHTILLGQITGFTHRDGLGLGYARGQYFSLGLERAAMVVDSTRRIVAAALVERDGHVLLEMTPGGMRPPQFEFEAPGNLRAAMEARLPGTVRLGSAYSIFDDRPTNTHYTCFLAQATQDCALEGRLVPIGDITGLTFETPAIAALCKRFALEHSTRDFTLYVGDEASGERHEIK